MHIGIGEYLFRQEFGYGESAISKTMEAVGQSPFSNMEYMAPFVKDFAKMDIEYSLKHIDHLHNEARKNSIGIYCMAGMFEFHTDFFSKNQADFFCIIDYLIKKFPELAYFSFNPLPLDWDNVNAKKSDKELSTQLKNMKTLTAYINKQGKQTSLHFHDSELAHGAREFHFMIDNTQKEELGITLDFNWCIYGGVQPQYFIDNYFDRIKIIHLRGSRNHRWLDVLEDGDEHQRALLFQLWDKGFDGFHEIEIANDPQFPPETDLPKRLQKSHEVLEKWRNEYIKSQK